MSTFNKHFRLVWVWRSVSHSTSGSLDGDYDTDLALEALTLQWKRGAAGWNIVPFGAFLCHQHIYGAF